MRPWTSSAVTKSRTSTAQTTLKPRHTSSAKAIDTVRDENDPEKSSECNSTDEPIITDRVKSRKLIRRDSMTNTTLNTKKEYKSLMQYGKEEPTLLEIHKDTVERKDYPRKIQELKDAIDPLADYDSGETPLLTILETLSVV